MPQNEGLFRFSGMYGIALRDGVELGEVTEVSGAVDINRIDVPLPGTTRGGYKTGREGRDGTLRIQKIDTRWEFELWQGLNLSVEERRRRRDQRIPRFAPFDLLLRTDDPDALGAEEWQLYGCLLWRLPIGFSIGDDVMEREFPMTWEFEEPLQAFRATRMPDGSIGRTDYVL